MARSSRIFLVRRSRDNLSAIFARRARRIGTHGLGVLQAESERSGRISIKNLEETERAGTDFWEIRNVPIRFWFTRNWSSDRRLLGLSRIANPGVADATAVASLNEIIGYSSPRIAGDETASGLSLLGGTSVTAFRMVKVNTGIEIGTDNAEAGNVLDESGNILIGENVQSVMQLSDGTFLSVDTLEVSGVGGGGGGSTTLTGLTDTTISGPTSGQVLKYNGSIWINDTDAGGSYTNADTDAHLNQSNPTSGYVLSWNGSDYAWVANSGGGGGSGDVVGPSSSTNNSIARFDTTTGKLIQNSGISVDDSNNVTGMNSLSVGLVSLVQNASIYFEGSTDDTFETQLTVVDPTADRILSLPDSAGTVATQEYVATQLATSAVFDSPNWYQTYANPGTGDNTAGSQINTLTPLLNTGPWHYGLTLNRGSEFLFDHTSSSQSRWLGIWGGGSTYTTTAVGTGSYWTKSIRFASASVSAAGSGNATKGFDLAADYTVTSAVKFALVYDYTTMKLQLWERSIGTASEHRTLITTASTAEDGNAVTISAAYHVLGADIPTFTAREHTWEIVANELTPDDTTWFDGVEVNTAVKHGTALHPGEKMSTVTVAGWAQQYFSWDYTGTATGQTAVKDQATSTLRAASTEKMLEDEGWTINTKSQLYDTGTTTGTMNGTKISFRYHVDNSVDLYDEDNEEVLFTKDIDFDGTPQYLHVLFSGGSASHMWFKDWTFEPFDAGWYYHSASKYKPNQRFTSEDLDGSNTGRVVWGELMYPGQELIFQETMTSSGNTHVGVRNADDTAWVKSVSFDGTNLRNVATGFDINGGTSYNVNNKMIALRYTKGDNKLKWWDINTTGVETLITTASVAEDGNGVRISTSGNNKVPNAPTLRYYGWEYIHTPTNHPQPWRNWRLDRPAVNDTIRNDTVLRQIRALIPGYFMRWTTANSATQIFQGGWKTSNPSSGQSNTDTSPPMWDWGWKITANEKIEDLKGMTFNTSNSNYNSSNTRWDDPNKGFTQIQLRYHSTNKIDLHDHTNNEIIATKDTDGDGNGVYFSAAIGVNLTNLSDNFFSGGDMTQGTSTFSPTFTTAPSMGYDDDGILNAGEMVRIDQAVAVGQRMIISPEFWGLLEDMGGVTGSGPAATGTGWVEDDNVVIGWQKANSPHVGTNIGNSNSGWDSAMYMLLRGAGTNHVSRIGLYAPGNVAFTARDGRVMTNNYTDLYFTFDRISSSSGRIMAFPSLATARAGIAGTSPETTWYANNDQYMTGSADTLTLTGDNYLYIYSHVGNFTLPTTTTDCIELVTIPT